MGGLFTPRTLNQKSASILFALTFQAVFSVLHLSDGNRQVSKEEETVFTINHT